MDKKLIPGSIRRLRFLQFAVLGVLLFFPITRDAYLIVQLTQFIIYGIFAMSSL